MTGLNVTRGLFGMTCNTYTCNYNYGCDMSFVENSGIVELNMYVRVTDY